MTNRIPPRAINATGYVGDGARALHDDGTWKIPAGGGASGGVQSIVPGTGIEVDATDPANPIVSTTAASGGSSVLVPLTTTVGGVPELVWDENDNLVMTEVPL